MSETVSKAVNSSHKGSSRSLKRSPVSLASFIVSPKTFLTLSSTVRMLPWSSQLTPWPPVCGSQCPSSIPLLKSPFSSCSDKCWQVETSIPKQPICSICMGYSVPTNHVQAIDRTKSVAVMLLKVVWNRARIVAIDSRPRNKLVRKEIQLIK